jgi:hypothetical protein
LRWVGYHLSPIRSHFGDLESWSTWAILVLREKLIVLLSQCNLCNFFCRVLLPMKNEVLDILILGLLVVLFASIYRKRASARLRCWVIGWILVLLHFAALLVSPPLLPGRQWSIA